MLTAAGCSATSGSASSVIIAVPTTLVCSAYSREFERDADAGAFAELKRRARAPEPSPKPCASWMRKPPAKATAPMSPTGPGWSYLSCTRTAAGRIKAAERLSVAIRSRPAPQPPPRDQEERRAVVSSETQRTQRAAENAERAILDQPLLLSAFSAPLGVLRR